MRPVVDWFVFWFALDFWRRCRLAARQRERWPEHRRMLTFRTRFWGALLLTTVTAWAVF